jgi:hypothetical protein
VVAVEEETVKVPSNKVPARLVQFVPPLYVPAIPDTVIESPAAKLAPCDTVRVTLSLLLLKLSALMVAWFGPLEAVQPGPVAV